MSRNVATSGRFVSPAAVEPRPDLVLEVGGIHRQQPVGGREVAVHQRDVGRVPCCGVRLVDLVVGAVRLDQDRNDLGGIGAVRVDTLEQPGEVRHDEVAVGVDVRLGGEDHVAVRLEPEVRERRRAGLDALQRELHGLVGDVGGDDVHLTVDERLRIEAHRHELVVDRQIVEREDRLDADLVALDAADALADEIRGVR